MPKTPEGREGPSEINNVGESIEELRAQFGEPLPNPYDWAFNSYDRITLQRTSGDMESDWYYLGLHPADATMVLSGKIGPDGKPIYHQDYFRDVAEWNNVKLPETGNEKKE